VPLKVSLPKQDITMDVECGHISITEHFKAWKNTGLTLGNLKRPRCFSNQAVVLEAPTRRRSLDDLSGGALTASPAPPA
jgi:hypothetical protein